LPPDQRSMDSRTSPPGRWKSATGHFLVYSRTKACQTSPEASRDVVVLFVRGAEWSLLTIQIPTASPGAFGSLGGARNPYAPKSAAASAVPVLTAAGRRLPPGPLRSSRVLAQIGFWCMPVLPLRMSLMRNADCGDTACVPSGSGAAYT